MPEDLRPCSYALGREHRPNPHLVGGLILVVGAVVAAMAWIGKTLSGRGLASPEIRTFHTFSRKVRMPSTIIGITSQRVLGYRLVGNIFRAARWRARTPSNPLLCSRIFTRNDRLPVADSDTIVA
jgi:hypothetical protein